LQAVRDASKLHFDLYSISPEMAAARHLQDFNYFCHAFG